MVGDRYGEADVRRVEEIVVPAVTATSAIGSADLCRSVPPVARRCEIELRTSADMPEVEALLRAIANASSAGERSVDHAKSAYFAGRIDVDEFESAIAKALDRDA